MHIAINAISHLNVTTGRSLVINYWLALSIRNSRQNKFVCESLIIDRYMKYCHGNGFV